MQLRNENPIHYSLMQTLPYQQTLLAKAETLESHMFPRHVLNPGRNSYNFIFKDKLTSSWDLECLAELLKEGNKSANYVSILPALNPKPNTQTKPQDRKTLFPFKLPAIIHALNHPSGDVCTHWQANQLFFQLRRPPSARSRLAYNPLNH